MGQRAERQAAERIAAGVPGSRVLPRATVIKGFNLINRAELVVGVDTGLVHIAAAPATEPWKSTATWRWKTGGC